MNDQYCVAIFGGAVAGSEAAEHLTNRGIPVVVFEQNALPFGKIETGLPKWHIKLRDKQELLINKRLSNPLVSFVPLCRLGEDIQFQDICKNWGFSAILLAVGAWRDRPFPVPTIEKYLEKGFYYQNPFVQWFNIHHDPAYKGPDYPIVDDAVVVGGGLASIDVVKILMIESFCIALRRRGVDMDILTVERYGIPVVCDRIGVKWDDLGLKGCTLYYRRRIIDMPLSSSPANDLPEEWQKTWRVREKIIELARQKYLFNIVECHHPIDIIEKDGKLGGLVFQKTKIDNGKIIPIEGVYKRVETSLVISSIGSIPEQLAGLEYHNEKFDLENTTTARLKGCENVFALGNSVTGKGNIKESQMHSRMISEQIIHQYLGLGDSEFAGTEESSAKSKETRVISEQIVEHAKKINRETYVSIINNVKKLQAKVGYDGDYNLWIKKHFPARLEKLINWTKD